MSIDDVADTINLLILHRLTPAMHEQLSSCHVFTTILSPSLGYVISNVN